ncbi:MAG: DUF5615 family PIN-like protein [Chloroflexota bacterium]
MRFYFDTHIARANAVQLRARGATVVRCEDVGLDEADDQTHLQYAADNDLVMVSQDNDFAVLDTKWKQHGKAHSGIILIPKHLKGQQQITFIVNKLGELHDMMEGGAATDADFEDKVHYP